MWKLKAILRLDCCDENVICNLLISETMICYALWTARVFYKKYSALTDYFVFSMQLKAFVLQKIKNSWVGLWQSGSQKITKPYTVEPRFTGSLNLPSLNSFVKKQALWVNWCKSYPNLPPRSPVNRGSSVVRIQLIPSQHSPTEK